MSGVGDLFVQVSGMWGSRKREFLSANDPLRVVSWPVCGRLERESCKEMA